MSAHRVVRASKFRNVYGTALKKEQCLNNIRVSKSSWDSTFCSVNPKFLAVIVESAGGGAFIVIQLAKDKVGKIKSDHPVVSGHKGPVLDIAWCPHNDNLIASGSEDCSVKIWFIPDEGLTKTLTEPSAALLYHQRRVGLVLWHPAAQDILLTAGSDNLVVIWNVGTATPSIVIDNHPDVIYSASWNWDGSKFLTTCRDKKIRVFDPRLEEPLEAEAVCHEGTKACRAIYLKNGMIFTTGFSKVSERQYSLRSPNRLQEPLVMMEIDTSNGVMFPFYDPDTNMIYLCGKGDSVMRYFEVTAEPPFVHYINTFQSPDPQRSIGMMPKRGCDVTSCEITRFYRLNGAGLCQVVSMTVPRKSELYQEDLYPCTLSPTPALTAEDWLSGKNENPVMMSMKTGCTVSALELEEENANPHMKLRRASCPISITGCHTPLMKSQSVPMDIKPNPLVEEVAQLKSLVYMMEQRIKMLEGLRHEERIQSLEGSNHEERIQALEAAGDKDLSLCCPSTPHPLKDAASSSTPMVDYRIKYCDPPVKDYGAVSTLSSFLASPMVSLSALSSQWSNSPLTSNLGIPSMPTPFKALKKLVYPLQGISSFSSGLISSFSPVMGSSTRRASSQV